MRSEKDFLEPIIEFETIADVIAAGASVASNIEYKLKNEVLVTYKFVKTQGVPIYFVVVQSTKTLVSNSYLHDNETLNPIDYSNEVIEIIEDKLLVNNNEYSLIEAESNDIDLLIKKLSEVKKSSGKVLSYYEY